ncbi:MAG: UDP-N-acetyl glucosamine 2-epimerase [Prevotella sp.]|nr:UDP-N-acetyl glucosamine 2-epimerase [Prevotella sp.]
MVKVCIVAGARPNFIKVAPLIRAMEKSDGICYELVYAGRADDATLEGTLFDDLQISRPTVFLDVDSVSLNEITGRVMGAFEKYLSTHPTDVVIVVDDLASTMAAAIVTKKQGVRLAHLVAGTRSFDINMPKEVNRLVIDGLSDLLFTAGMSASSITNREGAEQSRVYMVGNILIDNLRYNHDRWQRPPLMDEAQLADGRYLVFTLNRRALLRNEENLKLMMDALTSRADVPVVAVLRQEARRVVEAIVPPTPGFIYADPLPYLQFGYLTSHAMGIVTDSGNVAEEATFNGVPCITLNSYTEHIETVKVGTNVLVGEDAGQLAEALQEMVEGRWKKASLPERWDGRTAERIVRILTNEQ